MPTQLTAEDARQSLNEHVKSKAQEIHEKYGPHIGWAELQRILQDRTCVRYPCEIVFDAAPLQAGELAYPMATGDQPADGFTLYVHPLLMVRLEQIPHVVLYQLVLVNYGEFATADDAETFGATALGLSKDAYYQALCQVADEIAGTGGS
jgi:hypothetical protein